MTHTRGKYKIYNNLLKTTCYITYFYIDISTFKISTLSIVGSRITMNRSFFRLTPLFSSKLISVCVPLFCAARTVLCCLQFVRCPEIILKLTHKHEKPNHKLITDSPRSFFPPQKYGIDYFYRRNLDRSSRETYMAE